MKSMDFHKWSAEKIARAVFIAMIALTVLMFALFYLVGYDRPFDDNPEYNAPLLSGTLVSFTFIMVVITAVVWLGAFFIGIRKRGSTNKIVNGIHASRIVLVVATTTVLLLIATFLVGSSSPLTINGTSYDSVFWLKAADMFVYSIAAMTLLAVAALVFGMVKNFDGKGK